MSSKASNDEMANEKVSLANITFLCRYGKKTHFVHTLVENDELVIDFQRIEFQST